MERSGVCGSFIALSIVAALSLIATGIEPVAKIITESSSPVSITQYRAYYQQRVGTYINEGIRHELQYRNDSSRTIVAVQFGLISFSVFNDFLDRTGGVSMDEIAAGQSDSGTWIATALSDFTFLTGVAYVYRVRYSDGEIWVADLSAIVSELSKIEQGFDITHLTAEQ